MSRLARGISSSTRSPLASGGTPRTVIAVGSGEPRGMSTKL